jgi:hypothetical protein
MLKKRMATQAMNPPKLKKGPGLKKGGSVKKMKDGGGVCAGASNNRRSRQGAEIVK